MLVRGPFTLKWGGVTLDDIEAVDIEYEVNSEDYESNAGNVYQIDKSIKTAVRLTLLSTDIASLAAVLPQYFKAENDQMADGTFVFDERGGIDVTADDCEIEPIYSDLEIFACADPDESLKFVHTRTVIDSFEVGKLRKVVVKFIGEPEHGKSIVQILGDQGDEDFFMLGDNDLFILGDGSNLLL